MIEKLHLCHPHIALSLFLLEEDLSLWTSGENSHSHIHSLCPIGNLSRTSPFASLPSSKTLSLEPLLWGLREAGDTQTSPSLACTLPIQGPPASRRSFQAAHLSTWPPAEQWAAVQDHLSTVGCCSSISSRRLWLLHRNWKQVLE